MKRCACSSGRPVAAACMPRLLRSSAAKKSRRSRSIVAPQATAAAIACSEDIDVEDYFSGKPHATFIGRLVSVIVPPPLRFLASWVAPITCLIALHAQAVTALLGQVIGLVQAHVPLLAPLLQAYNFPWLAPATIMLLSCLPILYTFLAMPIIDVALGEEEDAGTPVDSDAWYKPLYRIVCHGFLLLHATVFFTAAQTIAHMSVPIAIVTCVNMGILGGFGFCVAHELVHSSHKFDRFCAQVLLTMLCYKQWALSHMAHHAQVATEGDPASAKYRESVYPFVVRSVVGEVRDAVQFEAARMDREMPSANRLQKLVCSRMPGWVLWPAALAAGLYAAFGAAAACMYVIAGAGGIFLLECVNYIEHYGLSRSRLANGKYERVGVGHAWNANHMMSNAVFLRLQRHSDHHLHGHRPYYTLNNLEGAPKLPASYSTMVLLAMLPPAWFCVMNPRVHMHRVLADIQRSANTDGTEANAEPPLDTAVLA